MTLKYIAKGDFSDLAALRVDFTRTTMRKIATIITPTNNRIFFHYSGHAAQLKLLLLV